MVRACDVLARAAEGVEMMKTIIRLLKRSALDVWYFCYPPDGRGGQ